MKVTIKGNEFELWYISRMHVVFEDKFNESINYGDTTYKNVRKMLYCCIIASMEKLKINETFTWDEFEDWLDDPKTGGFMYKLNEFGFWLAEQIRAQAELLPKKKDNEKEEKKSKKGKD